MRANGTRLTPVNISPLQLRDPWFAQKLLKLLVAANFPPSRLEIEITESALHHNARRAPLVTSLRNQGIAISLDDFGTGYSSPQLRKLLFDRIKIDRSFVSAMPHDRRRTMWKHRHAGRGQPADHRRGDRERGCASICCRWASSRARAISMASPCPPTNPQPAGRTQPAGRRQPPPPCHRTRARKTA
jgi:hypothetical protein